MHRLQERRAVAPLSEGDAGRASSARRRRLFAIGGVAALVLAADQITKSVAVADLRHGPVHVIGPFSFALTYNTGAAFSMGVGLTVPIVLIVLVVIGLLIWFGRSVPSYTAAVAVGMVLGGALGNLSDRFLRGHHGGVVDFVASTFWPTFNLADACVVCGSILLGAHLAFRRPTDRQAGTVGDGEHVPHPEHQHPEHPEHPEHSEYRGEAGTS